MDYCSLGFRKISVQITLKALRKSGTVLRGTFKRKKPEVRIFEMMADSYQGSFDAQFFSIEHALSPPGEAYMFFPLGRGPLSHTSSCFVAYTQDRAIAGWSWLHQGARKDMAQTYGFDSKIPVSWFGPDYVRPRFRGNALQKAMIYERIFAVQSDDRYSDHLMTLIAANNEPSKKSYGYFGFSERRFEPDYSGRHI